MGRYEVSYLAGYPEKNSESHSKGCGDRCSADRSADCPENRSGGNPESNQPSNGTSSLLGYPESNPADFSTSGRKSGSLAETVQRPGGHLSVVADGLFYHNSAVGWSAPRPCGG